MIFGNSKLFDRRTGLLLFALALWGWIGYSIFSHTAHKTIQTTIIQSRTPLRHLDDPIHPIRKEILWIDTLYFPKGNSLYNPIYGNLGYSHDFVILFDMDIMVQKDIPTTFIIYSDDGFRLAIDGKKIMEFTKDRPFSKSETTLTLKAGKHHIHIKYFQGYGQLGIVGYYKVAHTTKLLGQNSHDISFMRQ